MRLDTYIRSHGLSSKEFGKLAGIPNRATVHRYRLGQRFPNAENLAKIMAATGGLVAANDFAEERAARDYASEHRPTAKFRDRVLA